MNPVRPNSVFRQGGMITLLIALLCSTSRTVAETTFAEAFEAGKAFANNTAMPDAGSLPPEDVVPGFANASPQETTYYGDSAAMEEAAAHAATENEGAQTVTDGITMRPQYTIDPETDPMLQRAATVEASAAAIAGAIEGEYSECQPISLQTPWPSVNESCYENRPSEFATCDERLNISVEMESSCPAGTWWVEGTVHNGNPIDIMYAQAYCEPRGDGRQRFRVHAHGGNGACTDWYPFELGMTVDEWMLITTLRPVWYSASCKYLPAYVAPGSGCSGDDCRYTFSFGSPVYSCPSGQHVGSSLEAYDTSGDGVGGGPLPADQCYTVYSTGEGWCYSGDIGISIHEPDGFRFACASLAAPATQTGVNGWEIPLTFERPHTFHTITEETWDDGCAALEAQSQ